jgi:hypothetical protein
MARIRSPNYPAISLAEAVKRIEQVHARERQHPATREVIIKGMGYNGVHGASLGAISAAIKYGLLEQVGKGPDYKVSDRAVAILHPHEPAEKAEAIAAAARAPALFKELLEHFKGDLPSDDNLRAYLVRRAFSQSSLPSVIQSFRDTMELVSSDSGDYNGNQPTPEREAEPMTPNISSASNRTTPPPSGAPAEGGDIKISISSNRVVVNAWMDTPAKVEELMRMLKYAKLMLAQEQAVSDSEDEAAN